MHQTFCETFPNALVCNHLPHSIANSAKLAKNPEGLKKPKQCSRLPLIHVVCINKYIIESRIQSFQCLFSMLLPSFPVLASTQSQGSDVSKVKAETWNFTSCLAMPSCMYLAQHYLKCTPLPAFYATFVKKEAKHMLHVLAKESMKKLKNLMYSHTVNASYVTHIMACLAL